MLAANRFFRGSDLLWRRIASGIGWALVGSTILRGGTLIAGVLCARALSQSDFGRLSLLQTTIGLFGVLAGNGLGLAGIRLVAANRSIDAELASRLARIGLTVGTVTGGMGTIGFLLLSDPITQLLFGAYADTGVVRLSSLLVFSGVLGGIQSGLFVAYEEFRLGAIVGGIKAFVLLFGVWVGSIFLGLWGALLGFIAADAAGLLLSAMLLRVHLVRRRRIGEPVTFHREEVLLVLRTALPTVLSGFVAFPAIWSTGVFLARQDGGLESMARFSAAERWRQLLLFIPSTVANSTFPIMTNQYGTRDAHGFRRTFFLNVGLSVLGIALPAICLTLFRGQAMALFGAEYVAGGGTLVVLAWSAILVMGNTILGQVLLSHGKLWERLWMDILLAGLLAASAWYFIPSLHDTGLAWAQCIAYGGATLGLCFIAAKRISAKGSL